MIEPVSFAGEPHAVGKARAEALISLPMPHVSTEDVAIARACRDLVGELNPALIDLHDGLLEGGGWAPETFLVYFFARRQGLLRGCTNLAVLPGYTVDGKTRVGRNYDWAYSDLPYCEARAVSLTGARPFVSYTHHWVGHPDCLNASGLFVAISSLPAEEAPKPGVQWNLFVDSIAMTCDTVGQAVALLTAYPHLRAITYLLADATSAAAVEATPSGVRVRQPENGVVVATNHKFGANDESDRTRHSVARFNRATERLTKQQELAGDQDIVGVLRDPVCTIRDGKRLLHELDHVPLAALKDWGTIWSTIARPADRYMEIAQGHPDDAPYTVVNWQP